MKTMNSSPDQPDNHREETLFAEAVQIPDAQRRAEYLLTACPNDEDLRRKVESLVRAHFDAESFLSEPAVSAKTIADGTGAEGSVTEQSGQRIGPYKLLQQIGEGGCGVVFMAEQIEPVRRRVALKVIKLGMDTRQVVARFEAERQALAMMDHPNIARVLDAGATEGGRPYFVMELVRGLPITQYADENNLPTEERLRLFAQVCRAVQHAHQKWIIHRDLKPSNILVTLHDGVPVPKVIDFGIAKATHQQQLTDKTLFTAFEQFMGTPAYMSPEQAEMSGLDIDTRSDIYSLGVLLYELLTGQTPFDARQLLDAGIEEMRRTIREREPAKPSTRLNGLGEAELTTVAKHRRAEALKLVTLVRGDLDWVVMKCLDKDRMRRYDSAGSLAQDIDRHLSSEPVMACPPSALYRARKFIRRRRATVAMGAVIGLLLLAILGVHLAGHLRLKEAKARAELAAAQEAKWRKEAERESLMAKLSFTANGVEMDKLVGLHLPEAGEEQYFQRRVEFWNEAIDRARLALRQHPDEEMIRFFALQIIGARAQALYKTDQLSAAQEAAQEWLAENTATNEWYYGNVLHEGHILLGKIALEKEAIDEASQQLLAAGGSPGSPQLNSFGPDFTLARRLVEAGRTEAVLKYFDLVDDFWTDTNRLEGWRALVRDGNIPEDAKWMAQ